MTTFNLCVCVRAHPVAIQDKTSYFATVFLNLTAITPIMEEMFARMNES